MMTSSKDSKKIPDIFGRIHNLLPDLSRTQRRIADAILQDPSRFVEKPIEEIVPWIGVSAPTVTRFCRRVGCDGLRDLKLQIMGAIRVGARYLKTQEPVTSITGLRDQTAARAHDAIAQAMSIPDSVLDEAIAHILRADTIYAFGSGGVSSWLVEEFQNRFFRLGKTVVPCRDGIMQSMLAATMESDTLIVVCSLSGNNRSSLEAMQIAREYGAFSLAVCPPETEMAEMADLTVPVETHDSGDVLGPTSARYAMLYAIDVLALGVATRTREKSLETLRRLKHQFVSNVADDEMRPLAD